MFAISLRRIDRTRNMARFYALSVHPTLFGQWAVVRRWGRVNTDGRRVETWFAELSPALAYAATYVALKQRRGYTAV